VARAAEAVRAQLGPRRPAVAIVLGSGLGGLADRIGDAVRIPYADIPGFPPPTVEGHKGELVAGTLAGTPVVAQSGRFHLYEGHDAATAALPVRVFAALGVRTLVVTNAAGGVRRGFAAGTLMLITDHLNLTGRNPLVGEVLAGETRFPDMTAPTIRACRRSPARARRRSASGSRRGCTPGSSDRPTRPRRRCAGWSAPVPTPWGCPPSPR
jgi:purine-nucleoside phosphorylase